MENLVDMSLHGCAMRRARAEGLDRTRSIGGLEEMCCVALVRAGGREFFGQRTDERSSYRMVKFPMCTHRLTYGVYGRPLWRFFFTNLR